MRGSPWHGLTSTQVAQLEDALWRIDRRKMPAREAETDVFAEFSGRAARLLVSNDLRGAWDAACIAVAAENLSAKPRRNLEKEPGRVVGEDPATAEGIGKNAVLAVAEGAKVKESGAPRGFPHATDGVAPAL